MVSRLRETEASQAWKAILTAFTELRDVLAEEMEAETDLTIDRYEVLLMLVQATDRQLQPSEIADRRRLSRSGATRLIDRLVRDGLAERRPSKTDGRVSFVGLTSKGRKEFTIAGRVHLRGIDEHVGSHLSTRDMNELRRILAKLPGPR